MPINRSFVDNQFISVGIGIAPSATAILTLPAGTTVATGGILWGTDTNLYRSAADVLRTDDTLVVGGSSQLTLSTGIIQANRADGLYLQYSQTSGSVTIQPAGTATAIINLGNVTNGIDTNLYRAAADTLKTDDSFVALGSAAVGSASLTANQRLSVTHNVTDAAASQYGNRSLLSHTQGSANASGMYALNGEITISGSGGSTGIIVGLTGQTTYNNSGTGTNINGTQGLVTQGASGGGVTVARGCYYRVDNSHATNPIVTALGAVVAQNIGAGPITNNYGMQIQGLGATSLAVGLDIGAQAGTTTSYGLSVAEPTVGVTRRAVNLYGTGGTAASGITFGADTTLYRSAADTLKTDDAFQAASYAVGATALASTHLSDTAALARLASPTFTGTPTLPTGTIAVTQTAGNNTTAVATTAFVTAAVATVGSDPLKANLASPTFTGTVTTPAITVSGSGKTMVTLADTGAQSSGLTIGGDTNLYRSTADTLKTDDSFIVGGPSVQLVDGVYRAAVNSAGNQVFDAKVTGDTWPRLAMHANTLGGSISFGPGGSTLTDTNLYRSGPDALKTDDALEVVGALTKGGVAVVVTNDLRLSDSRAPNGSASGDLSGSYPNPQIALGAIVSADVNASLKNAVETTPSLRSLGNTQFEAMPGLPQSDLSWNNRRINLLQDPTAVQDAANKRYVDTRATKAFLMAMC